MNRRDLLQFGAGAMLNATLMGGSAAVLARPAFASVPAPQVRRLSFINTHTGETFNDAYFERGAYSPDALDAINRVMRDHRSNEIHAIDTGLLDQLADLKGQLDSAAPYQIISGYRSPASNAALREHSTGVASRSLHMDGRAIDVRVRGIDTAHLRDAAIRMQRGGVGYYQSSDFVHLDTGRVRRW